MKTLIIHPADPSTFFLDIVYESVQDKTLITGGVSPYTVILTNGTLVVVAAP